MGKTGLAGIALVLAGCATPPAGHAPEVLAAAQEPLYCAGEDECRVFWRRAQVWLAQNSYWKVQTVSDALIVTFTPTRASPYRGYRIVREPQADGRDRIMIASGCANIFGCASDELDDVIRFKTYVKTGRGATAADMVPVQSVTVAPAPMKP